MLRVLEDEKLVERAARVGAELQQRLARYATEKPEHIESVRGRGLLVGAVLTDAESAATLPKRALERGVIVNVTAGRVMRFFPALNIPEEDLWSAIDTLLELIVER